MGIFNKERGGLMTREVEFNDDDLMQVCRVKDAEWKDAYEDQLMFVEVRGEVEDNTWVGKTTDEIIPHIASEPVVLRFKSSEPILRIVLDLMVIYGNLKADGK